MRIPKIRTEYGTMVADNISKNFSEHELCFTIAYLQYIIQKQINVGNEINELGIAYNDCFSFDECFAMRNRIVLAVWKILQRRNKLDDNFFTAKSNITFEQIINKCISIWTPQSIRDALKRKDNDVFNRSSNI